MADLLEEAEQNSFKRMKTYSDTDAVAKSTLKEAAIDSEVCVRGVVVSIGFGHQELPRQRGRVRRKLCIGDDFDCRIEVAGFCSKDEKMPDLGDTVVINGKLSSFDYDE